jgi:prevent-host-death family protein
MYTVSATDLKNNVSAVLNTVYFENKPAVVERHGKPIVKIVPVNRNIANDRLLEQAVEETFGILPNFPDVKADRKLGTRNIGL